VWVCACANRLFCSSGHPNFHIIVHDIVDPITLEVDEIYHLACPSSPVHYQVSCCRYVFAHVDTYLVKFLWRVRCSFAGKCGENLEDKHSWYPQHVGVGQTESRQDIACIGWRCLRKRGGMHRNGFLVAVVEYGFVRSKCGQWNSNVMI
jgi:hypothetical protein